MELDTNYKESKSIFKKIRLKPILIIAISVILIAAVIVFVVFRLNSANKTVAAEQRTTKVAKGNISVSVTGSGPIVSSNESDVTSSVTGKITKIYHKEGDTVKKGDILFELDDSDAKLNVEKIKNSIAQAQLTNSTNYKSLNSLDVSAPYDGQVTNVATLKVGDEVNKGATILTITDTSRLKLNVSFSGAIIDDISVGQKVIVNIQDLMQSVNGTITYISAKPTTTGSGGSVYDTEITIDNPGSLKADMSANVEIDTKNGTEMSTNAGKLEYVDSQVVKSFSGGTVESISVKENQFVKAGQTLIKFSNDDLEISAQTNELKMLDLKNQLATAEKQLTEYKIYAPIDGIIVSQELKAGNSVKPADVLTTITDPGHMEFEVTIDELDISKIKVGQKVNITVDALSESVNKPLSGQISKIAIQGSSSNGVTTYPVTVQVNETNNLKVGMNANAEIIISEKTDILVLPLDAVQKMGNRSFVMVKSDGTNHGNTNWRNNQASGKDNGQTGNRVRPNRNNSNSDSNAQNDNGSEANRSNRSGNLPASSAKGNSAFSRNSQNVMMRPVEVGINNDEFIEIANGLKEGDEVILPQLATGTTQGNQQIGGGGFAIPSMGGGGFGGQRTGGNNQIRVRNNSQR